MALIVMAYIGMANAVMPDVVMAVRLAADSHSRRHGRRQVANVRDSAALDVVTAVADGQAVGVGRVGDAEVVHRVDGERGGVADVGSTDERRAMAAKPDRQALYRNGRARGAERARTRGRRTGERGREVVGRQS